MPAPDVSSVGVRTDSYLIRKLRGSLASIFVLSILLGVCARESKAQCSAPPNPIVAENCLPGNDRSEWDIQYSNLAGDPSIQGFGTDISVNVGGTISFKINTSAKAYSITIYRMGYYGGMGARKIATITPSVSLPQTQPACLTDASTGLYDCGNWAVSASWTVPSTATSGIYFAHLVRTDTGGDSHIVFVVRNDSSTSDILFQTNDETWQAYNYYGGGSLYGPNTPSYDLTQRAYKVSYNRPFDTRGFQFESATWVFGAEFPMVEFLEANGYNVTYFTGVDAARNGSLILNHKVYLCAGHDEYWSGPHRTNVEAARNAGVNMAFFTGNEVFWKTRWESSIDGTNTSFRTLVCYKETLAFAPLDPNDPPTWTGTWRDPSFSPPADGGRPENALTGTLFMVNGIGSDNPGNEAITVPAADGKMRFWRNTAIANQVTGASHTLPEGTLGYEWNVDVDNGSRPAGAFHLSTTTYTLTTDYLLDWGATYGAGTATHNLMMYRASSGALVFGAGTVQWSWGLNANHDNPFGFDNTAPDPNMQQATVNLFADMGVQPATLISGLVPATASTDRTAPISAITSPTAGTNLAVAAATTITGTATDSGGGIVAGVEVSTDGGNTWHPAIGRGSWSYTWTPTVVGSTTIQSRAVDDSGNLENPSSGVSVTVMEHDCPCETWPASAVPVDVDSGDKSSVEVGVKFRTDYSGYITGIRFYKSSANTGTHIGNLWTSSGALLASAVFTGETSSGWQQVNFSTPAAVSPNTTYIASYFAPSGHYSADSNYFATRGQDDPPVHLLANGVDGSNGVYAYGSSSAFPTKSYLSTNYWVDVVFVPNTSMVDAPPALLLTNGNLSFTAFVGSTNPPSQSFTVFNEGTGALNWTASTNAPWLVLSATSGTTPQSVAVSVNPTGLAAGTYTGTITLSAPGATNPPQTVSVTLTVTNLLLSSNFASQGTQGWVLSPFGVASSWSIVNDALEYNGSGNSQLFAGNSAWTNYTVNATFMLSTLQDWPGGIRGRVNPSTGAGYMVWVYPALGEIILYNASAWNINQPLTQLGGASASFDTTNSHNLGLSFTGSQIQVLYDGKVIITATDSTYGSGLVALEGDSQVINFQQVLVTSSTTANTGSISTASNSLTFSTNYGGANPAAQSVAVSAGGGGVLAWTATSNASWLGVSPSSGTTPGTIQVSVSSSSLAGGTYTGTITVFSLGAVNQSQQVTVTLTVTTAPPSLVLAPAAMSFVAITGQPAPAAQPLSVVNGGYGSFSWTASTDSSWLSATPSSGSTPGSVSVSSNAAGLGTGNYNGNVIITAQGVSNSPISVPVNLQVFAQDMSENFSDLANGWIISPMGQGRGWSASNGVYSYSGLGLSQSCTGNSAWSNYTFDTSIKLSSLSNWPGGVRGRVNPATGAGYAVWLYPGSSLAILYKVGQWNINGSTLTELAQASLSFDTSNFHDFRMAFNGSTISVSWDGTVLMSASDPSYTSGFVCLDADNQPIAYSNVQVAAVQNQVTLDAPSPSTVVLSALPGSTSPNQTVNITAAGTTTAWAVTSSASWLTATASTTLTPGTITVSANAAGLAEGTYSGTLTISAPGATNSPLTIPVTLAVKTAVLSVKPGSLAFFGATTVNPIPQNVQVTNLGTGNLGWSASATSSWLGLSATTGSAPSTISVQPNTTALATGAYTDTITVTSPDVANSPATVPVSAQVGTMLFSDNFSSGAGNWTISPLGHASGWSVINGAYTYNGEGHTQVWAGSNSWTNYTVAVNFQLSTLNDYPGGLRGRVNTSTGSSYGVWIYPAEGILKLFRIGQWDIDADLSLLGQSGPVTIDTNVHNLRLCFQSSQIQVYYDNVLVITETDSSYTQGAIALDVSSQPIAFSNVQVIGF
ncbi:MAG: DUF4082 domain-containing protein [Acidobacteriaceae bacterium]|nr:DUF4082 domain-containing protein [Acidobacteriaceae bacterium]